MRFSRPLPVGVPLMLVGLVLPDAPFTPRQQLDTAPRRARRALGAATAGWPRQPGEETDEPAADQP